jgi:TPR repeat protein
LLYFEGTQVAADPARALRWFTRSAQGGNAFAQAWLGDVLTRGQGVVADRDAALIWYERAALQGHAGAIAAVTSLRMAAGAGGNELAEVFALWLKAAERGDANAQRVVGDFYLRGVGTEASVEQGRRWLNAAVLQGHVPAMVLLAGVLLQHPTDPADQAQAVELFRRAAGHGNVDAQYNLGVCLRRGLGVARDDAQAEQVYRAAALKGHRSAQLALGSLKAQTATRDEEWSESAHWYRLAAEAGHPSAMMSLAELHERGRGVAANRDAALTLYQQALAAGHAPAAAELKRLEAGKPQYAG